jgi:hypothetical protein
MLVTYKKTEKGNQVLLDKSVPLPSRQRMLFILIDGKSSLETVLASTKGIGITLSDIETLIRLNLIELIDQSARTRSNGRPIESREFPRSQMDDAQPVKSSFGSSQKSASKLDQSNDHQSRYEAAYPIAVSLSATLGIWGFKLNLAVEQAMGYDDLVALLPRLQQAIGKEKCQPLEDALLL